MKSIEQINNALSIKESELVAIKNKLDSLQAWIDSAIFGQNESFIITVFAEKTEVKNRESVLKMQIEFLKWILGD